MLKNSNIIEHIFKNLCNSIDEVALDISKYVVNPNKDFTRSKKLPVQDVIKFLIFQGSSGTKNEIYDYFLLNSNAPSASALNQRRSKLMSNAFEAVFKIFNEHTAHYSDSDPSSYDLIAADGSTFTFFSKEKWSCEEYHVTNGHSAKGFYSMHLNAFYNLTTNKYLDAIIQPVHNKNEFGAFCDMVDRNSYHKKTIFIADRGYCSYNNMAHVVAKNQYFLFRSKDINSKGILSGFEFPKEETFDIHIKVTLVRKKSKDIIPIDRYWRFIDSKTTFDFIEYGSKDTYSLEFRVVRFPISDTECECIITNLPEDELPTETIKTIYFLRWGIETSFRNLKYTIGLSNFHSYKPEQIKQEIWAKLIVYNFTQEIIASVTVNKKEKKHSYKVNFTVASHVCRVSFRADQNTNFLNIVKILEREIIPIRDGRKYERLKTAHFRKPRYTLYRAS